MSKTKVWQRFGRSIADQPGVTLAAFLAEPQDILAAQDRNVIFPTISDFEDDRAYDPNPHRYELDQHLCRNLQLVLCLMTWGQWPILKVVNACSQLQCTKHTSCDPALASLRDATASAVQSYIDDPADQTLKFVSQQAKACMEMYDPYGEYLDDSAGETIWSHLGAPWFAAEAVCGDWSLQSYDGDGPPVSQSTWINRNSVWPRRAVETAAEWSSNQLVHDTIRSIAIDWATSG